MWLMHIVFSLLQLLLHMLDSFNGHVIYLLCWINWQHAKDH